jgi:hypothetical protein
MTMTYQRADDTLNAALRGVATPHLLLHVGDPGEDGTDNVAQTDVPANIVRKALTFGDAPANHAVNDERFVLNTAAVEWSGAEIDAAQEITHFSIWDDDDAGATQPEFTAAVTTPKTTGSDGVRVAIGDLEVAIEVHVKPA